MKHLLRVRTLASCAILMLLCTAFNTIPATNFSGTWKLNEGKSELGQFGTRASASKLVVTQQDNGVSIERTSTDFSGAEVVTTETLTNDGKKAESTVFGNSPKTSSLKWNEGSTAFTITYTINFNMNGQAFDIAGTESWTLSADGKTLTLTTKVETPNGEMTTEAVYDKE